MISVDGWEPRSLSALAEYINGYPFKPDDWGKEGLPIIRIEQLKNPEGPADHYAGELPSAVVIDEGDLIFSWSASLFLRIWKQGRAALNQHLFKVVERDGVDRNFLKAFIEFYLPYLTKASHGSTMRHITRKELERFAAPFPTCEHEQSKIAEVLSTVDQAIEQTKALIAKQQRIKTGLMQDLLTRGIDEHGNLRSERTHEFKDSLLGRVPAGWSVATLNQLTPADEPIGYGIVQPGSYDPSGVRVAGIYTLNSDFAKWHMSSTAIEAAYQRSRIRPGDVLLSIKGSTGRVGVVPPNIQGNISRELARIRPASTVNPHFLRFQLSSNFYQRYLVNAEVGTTRAELSIKVLRELFAVVPPRAEQDQIVLRLSSVERNLNATHLSLENLQRMKTGLMQDLLTGNRRVTPLLEKREGVTR